MFEQGKSGPGRRRKSLLSFSRDAFGVGSAAPAASTLAGEEGARRSAPDAPARHQMARSRREARGSHILSALAASQQRRDGTVAAGDGRDRLAPAPETPAPGSETPASDGGLGGQLRKWMRGEERPEPPPYIPDEELSVRRPPDRAPAPEPPVSPEGWTPLIDPMRVIGGIFESKRLIVAATILGLLAGLGVALTTPKKFMAATELLIDPRDLKLSDRDLTQQGLPSDATLAIVENQVRILTSGTVLGKVVDRLNLTEDDEFNGRRKSFGVRALVGELRALLSRRSDDGADDGREKTVAIEHLADSLSVERGGKTFVVTIAVKTESPQKSALIANTMTDVFLETYGQLQAQTMGRASDELNASLDEMRSGVEAAERKVAEFKATHDIIDPQGRPITDDEIVKLNEQLSVARARTLELNARAASVRGADVDSIVGGAIPESINSSIITELRTQYASLKSESDRMAVRLGPRHPDRLAIDAQLVGARQQISAELRRIAGSIQVELKRAVELEQQLAQRLAQLKVRQGDIGTELVQLRELEREVATKRAVYESFLLRAKETGEQREINTANMSVISRAYAPLSPSGPSRTMIVLAGMILGFGSGVGFAALRGAYEGLSERRRQDQRRRTAAVARSEPPDRTPPADPRPPSGSPPGGGLSAPRDARPHAPAGDSAPQSDEDRSRFRPFRAAHPPAYAPHPEGYAGPDEAMPSAYVPVPPSAYAVPHEANPVPHYSPSGWPVQAAPAAYPPPSAYAPAAVHGHRPAYMPPPMTAGHPVAQASSWAYPRQAAPVYPVPQRAAHAGAVPHHHQAMSQSGQEPLAQAIDDIRASLAECRDAIHDLSAERRRRRAF